MDGRSRFDSNNQQQNGEGRTRNRSAAAAGSTEEFANLQNINTRLIQRNLKERIRESFPAVIIGIGLILAGAGLLFWNEGQAVSTVRSLDEGYNAVVKVPTSEMIDRNNDGKLVHVWGTLSIVTPPQDGNYGISVRAVQMKRRVQIYQWVEEESSFVPGEPGDSSESSYSYSQAWKDKLIDSSSFYIPWGHENPTSIPIPSLVQTSEIVNVGAYQLSPAIKNSFSKFIPFSGDEQPDTEEVKLHNGMYYITKDIFNPETGDLRIQFYYAGHDGDVVTIISKQSSQYLRPYVTSSGKELLIVRLGKLSTEEMFSSEHAQNRFLMWMNRMAGWFLIFIGMTAISSIIQYLVVLSPILRDVIFLGLGSANLTLSMSLSLILIGGAWCFYRPGLALFILIVATLPLFRALFWNRGNHGRSRVRGRE